VTDSKTYAGLSGEARRDKRREQLLDAGFELLGTRGWAGFSVRAVCREARLSSRFFYESFENLDALAVAVFDRGLARTTKAFLRAVAEAEPTPHAQAHAAISSFVRTVTDDPRNARIAFAESLVNPALMQRRRAAMREGAAIIAAHGRATYPAPPGDALVDVTATLLAGGIAELLLAWLDGELAVSRDELIDECAALFMATVEGALKLGAERPVA
jgi:AcrR family transcriptional regulator